MSATEEVANWMMAKGIATGHGDTLDDLLCELVLHCSDHARTVTAARYGEASEQWQAGFECGGNAAANRVREIVIPQQPTKA